MFKIFSAEQSSLTQKHQEKILGFLFEKQIFK